MRIKVQLHALMNVLRFADGGSGVASVLLSVCNRFHDLEAFALHGMIVGSCFGRFAAGDQETGESDQDDCSD